MTLSRRKTLALIGGGVILAATASLGAIATRQPRTASLPWGQAGVGEDVRHRALSCALLAPNPHNRQPWLVDLREKGVVTLYVDTEKLLPRTDPVNRQITIGLGCFLELMRMAASHDGHRVEITPFPEGFDDKALDARPVARAVFAADASVVPDVLFAHVLARRSNKEPYDTARPLPADTLEQLAVATNARFGGTIDATEVAGWRAFTHKALRIEIDTPQTYKESADLMRIGRTEVDANPDGIDFTGPLFEVLGATGLMTREGLLDTSSQAYQAGLDAVFANTDTAMGHVWLVTAGNSRLDQIATGADWLRVNLAATAAGVAFQPLSQALQEYPEMAALYRDLHAMLAPQGGTVQMLARIGYGPERAQTRAGRWRRRSRMPDPSPTPEAQLFAFFNEVAILAQLSRAMFEARLPAGFNQPQFAVLNHLIRVRNGQTPLALARAFQVPKTSMTHSLAVLERHGLIEMRPNARDGRSKCVFITDAGRAFRQGAVEGLMPDMQAIAAAFPADRAAAVLPVLTDLRRVMDAMRDPEGGL